MAVKEGDLAAAQRRGDVGTARSLYREGLSIRRKMGEPQWILESVEALTVAHATGEQAGRAVRLFAAVATLRARHDLPPAPAEFIPENCDAAPASVRAALGEAAFTAAWAEGEAMTLEDAVALALNEATRDG